MEELVRKSNMSFGAQFAFAKRYITNRRLRGKLLVRLVKTGKLHHGPRKKWSHGATISEEVHIGDLGLTKSDSSRDQKIATLTDKQFDKLIAEVEKKKNKLPTMSGMVQAVSEKEAQKKITALRKRKVEPAIGEYDIIVIDPPWKMQKIKRDKRPNQVAFNYPTMTVDELQELTIPMGKDCHVWLWTTHKYLPDAFGLLSNWGLRYVCTFVWHKPGGFQPVGLPQYNCEFALYAKKGKPIFTTMKNFKLCFNAPRGKHSEKPDAFYEMIVEHTAGTRLNMFARRNREGFEVWGNEV